MTTSLDYSIAALLTPRCARARWRNPRPPVRDNSFLVEEAYNQEGRVVQHISVFSLVRRANAWEYGFTQEWPLGSQRHQLSVTVPVLNAADATGVGDIAVNYRYQLAFDDATGNAVAPRVSLLLPTGDAKRERGTASLGVQMNLPVSWGLHRALVTHWNVGGTWIPAAQAPSGGRVATRGLNAAASAIWLAKREVNLMLEVAWARVERSRGRRHARHRGIRLALPGRAHRDRLLERPPDRPRARVPDRHWSNGRRAAGARSI